MNIPQHTQTYLRNVHYMHHFSSAYHIFVKAADPRLARNLPHIKQSVSTRIYIELRIQNEHAKQTCVSQMVSSDHRSCQCSILCGSFSVQSTANWVGWVVVKMGGFGKQHFRCPFFNVIINRHIKYDYNKSKLHKKVTNFGHISR